MPRAAQAWFWKRHQKTLAPWLFLAPGMTMFLVYVILPIFQSMWISLSSQTKRNGERLVSRANAASASARPCRI